MALFGFPRIVQGSESDREVTNVILEVLAKFEIFPPVSTASCHWHTGKGLEEFILGLDESMIVYVGGM